MRGPSLAARGEQGRNPNGEKFPCSFLLAGEKATCTGRGRGEGGGAGSRGEQGLGEQRGPRALPGAAPPAEPGRVGRSGPGPRAARGGSPPQNGAGEDGTLHKPTCHPRRRACGSQVSNNSPYLLEG